MGKVLSSFGNGFPGAISRAIDDVVIAMPNHHTDPIPFGTPVVLSSAGNGVVPFGAANTAAQFVGVAVRNPSKTPETYGESAGTYLPGDLVDVIVRGHVTVHMPSTYQANVGTVVSIVKATGEFSIVTGDTVVPIPNAHVTTAPDSNQNVEIVINNRNLV